MVVFFSGWCLVFDFWGRDVFFFSGWCLVFDFWVRDVFFFFWFVFSF